GDAFSIDAQRPGPRGGLLVSGTITETGKTFDAMVTPAGELAGIRTAEGATLPQSVIAALLPQSVQGSAILSEFGVISAIGSRDGHVMLGGQDAAGVPLRAGFDASGQMMRFDRGDQARGGPGMGRDHGGKRMHGNHGGKGRGNDLRTGPRGSDQGERGGPRRGDRPRAEAPAPIDEAALRSAAEAAGYTDLGAIRPARGGAVIEAVNPQGENVLVAITREGEVLRETAR
ncbi:MAG: hypothetical protein Q4G26_10840, partial [Paracoccus sp. (in: a-proteobacteria)]|nr:hypothetical protein [Paracoccus sp. (in: a-proteobacteria)]